MKVLLLVLMLMTTPIYAASWSAVGVAVFKIDGVTTEPEVVVVDGFETYDLCMNGFVKVASKTDEYIGKGGTDNKVKRVDYNFDGDCFQKQY